MPSKNTFSGIKGVEKQKSILPNKGDKTKQIGRPKKAPEDKRNQKVTLSFTPKEKLILEEKSGLVDNATYLHDFLVKKGFFNSDQGNN